MTGDERPPRKPGTSPSEAKLLRSEYLREIRREREIEEMAQQDRFHNRRQTIIPELFARIPQNAHQGDLTGYDPPDDTGTRDNDVVNLVEDEDTIALDAPQSPQVNPLSKSDVRSKKLKRKKLIVEDEEDEVEDEANGDTPESSGSPKKPKTDTPRHNVPASATTQVVHSVRPVTLEAPPSSSRPSAESSKVIRVDSDEDDFEDPHKSTQGSQKKTSKLSRSQKRRERREKEAKLLAAKESNLKEANTSDRNIHDGKQSKSTDTRVGSSKDTTGASENRAEKRKKKNEGTDSKTCTASDGEGDASNASAGENMDEPYDELANVIKTQESPRNSPLKSLEGKASADEDGNSYDDDRESASDGNFSSPPREKALSINIENSPRNGPVNTPESDPPFSLNSANRNSMDFEDDHILTNSSRGERIAVLPEGVTPPDHVPLPQSEEKSFEADRTSE